MLNIAVVEEWAGDLAQGRWRQGSNKLRPTPNTRCCLGGLCEVVQSTIGGHWHVEHNDDYYSDFAGEYYYWDAGEWRIDGTIRDDEVLPSAVAAFVGIENDGRFVIAEDTEGNPVYAPIVIDGGKYESLADANDRGCSFEQIAGVLREWIEIAKGLEAAQAS